MNSFFLATPGPVNVPNYVSKAMQQVYHHRTKDFALLHQESCVMLSYFFDSPNPSIILPCSGTGVMEATLTNLLSPKDKIICLEFGKFSERFRFIAEAFDCTVISLTSPYGTYPSPEQVQKALLQHPDAKMVTTCHSETSTCVLAPVEEYAKIISKTDALFVVDTISSAGVCPINQEKHHIDICLGAGHKGFMTPPGIAFISYYGDKVPKALDRATIPKFYFNLKKEISSQQEGLSLWTPALSLVLGLHSALTHMLDEGIDSIYERHQQLSHYTLSKGKELGLKNVVQGSYACSPSVSGFFVPHAETVIKEMFHKKIIVAGGQGEFSHKIIRIGHLGAMQLSEIKSVMDTLSQCI